MPKRYLAVDVNTAAVERLDWVFATFERAYVSYSAGKDSTVLLHLAAWRPGRQVSGSASS